MVNTLFKKTVSESLFWVSGVSQFVNNYVGLLEELSAMSNTHAPILLSFIVKPH